MKNKWNLEVQIVELSNCRIVELGVVKSEDRFCYVSSQMIINLIDLIT